ncbi:uncharacterized protein LOC129952101 [Eupeodes corollae]|uniref:uncharacterized protein LOC129952101 n=1 Tax=Eupeodes corollae TaxID=290404 RepID=UPI00248F84AC|nr:uncharacterized protein LOC129952101 [Eupeodes corollae]
MEKRSKRWTTDETKAFLHFYAARKEQFSHPRKKRSAYGSIVEDMIAAGFDSGLTSRHLEVKMQTLLRAYRDAKDNNGRTGASPCIAPFLEEMDELFGKKPNFAKSDSYNFGAKSVSVRG